MALQVKGEVMRNDVGLLVSSSLWTFLASLSIGFLHRRWKIIGSVSFGV